MGGTARGADVAHGPRHGEPELARQLDRRIPEAEPMQRSIEVDRVAHAVPACGLLAERGGSVCATPAGSPIIANKSPHRRPVLRVKWAEPQGTATVLSTQFKKERFKGNPLA